jgi:hypothetical protein
MGKSITIMLVYEPETSEQGPVPIARIVDRDLAVMVARSAVAQAQARAAQVFRADEFLGEVEQAEARRLRDVLMLFIPEFRTADAFEGPALTQLAQ